ncbi:MAG: Trk system potassium transporter TrkA [Rickettsiales bacterium]
MKILICGAGQVGSSIARQLSREGHEITLIDQNAELIQDINASLDVKAIVGHASHPSILENAGAAESDMLIAVTYSDEVNIVACEIGHALFNVSTRIARIRNQDYLLPKWKDLMKRDRLPIDVVISPEIEVAETILRRMHVPGALDTLPFADGALSVMSIRLEETSSLNNIPFSLAEQITAKKNIALIGVVKQGKFILPTPGLMLEEHDTLYLVCTVEKTKEVLILFGHHERQARKMVIIGGGNIGYYLAEAFEQESHEFRVSVVEADVERAEMIAGTLERTTVIQGSGLDREILMECDIDQAETVIAVTNDDKVNILSALLAKRLGCKSAVILVNNYSYMSMLGNLGIDVIVNPRETTVSSILQHVRRGNIRDVQAIEDGTAEIIEAEAVETSAFTGKPIGQVKLPRGVVLGAIWRKGQMLLPDANLVIQPKDRVIILALAESVKKVEQMFSVSLEYF